MVNHGVWNALKIILEVRQELLLAILTFLICLTLLLFDFFTGHDGLARESVEAIVIYVYILMINLIGKRHHLANSRPITWKAPIGCQDGDPFESVERNGLWVEELGVLQEHGVESIPGVHHLVVSFLSFLLESWILEPIEVFHLPIH